MGLAEEELPKLFHVVWFLALTCGGSNEYHKVLADQQRLHNKKRFHREEKRGREEISFVVALVCIRSKKREDLSNRMLSLPSFCYYYPIIVIHGRHCSAKVHASSFAGCILCYILCAARLGSVEEENPTGVVDGDMFQVLGVDCLLLLVSFL